MMNQLLNTILRNKQIIPIVVAVASIGLYMAPTNAFASILGGTSGSITGQFLGQQNSISATNTGDNGQVSANDNTQTNIGANIADLNVGSGGTDSAVVGTDGGNGGAGTSDTSSHTDLQILGQSNSITATNTGASGTVSASGNTQTNFGINAAHINVGASSTGPMIWEAGSNSGGSHTDIQALLQRNSIDASNSGTGGTVTADNNHQTNIGINAAHVSVPQLGTILGAR
jgi:hypothetical protein